MKRMSKRILSYILVCLLIFTNGMPVNVLAQEEANITSAAGGKIITFAELPEKTMVKEVPLGTTIEELGLPDSLLAEVVQEEKVSDLDHPVQASDEVDQEDVILPGTATISVPVKEWVCQPDYDGAVVGRYVFTPVFDEQWSLEENATVPDINVQVVLGIMPLISTGGIIDLGDSDADLSAGASASSGKYSYDAGTKVVTIHSGPVTITGRTMDRQVVVRGGVTANITLDDVNIDVSGTSDVCAFEITDNSTVNLILSGTNTVDSGPSKAGLQVNPGSTLTISGADTASLIAIGGRDSAGIGGGSSSGSYTGGTIKITGGTVNATGRWCGAGIGGGLFGSGGTIEITGGKVTAIGGGYSAGIGGGPWADGGNITISGGTVNVTSDGDNDIGPGNGSSGGTITITGGSVNPIRGKVSPQPTNGSASVCLNTLTVGNPSIGDDTAISAIEYDSTWPYGNNDVVAKNGGILYLWLPQNSNTNAKVSVTAGGTEYLKTWARTGTTETQTLLRPGNADTPVINTQPFSGIWHKNTNATLSVGASITDEGTLSYQWYRNSQNNTTGGTPVGINSGSYSPPTSAVGILYYYCVVTNTNESVAGQQTATTTSDVAKITVIAAPTIGAITAPAAVSEGQQLTLTSPMVDDNGDTITAAGWQISPDGNTGWTLFNPATVMDFSYNDQYLRYYAENTVGISYNSNTVQIKVKIAPTVGSVIAPATVTEGSLVSLITPTVAANNAVISSEGWQISDDGSTNWIAFDSTIPVTLTDHNKYIRYVAENSEGIGYSPNTVQIKVIAEPTVGNIDPLKAVSYGAKLILTPPNVVDNNDPVTAEGWEISADGSTGWAPFDPLTAMNMSYSDQHLRYYAENSVGISYSPNTVQIRVYSTGGGAPFEPIIDTTMPAVATKAVSGKVKNGTLTITITKQMAKNAIQAATERIPKGKEANGIAVVFTANGSGTWSSLTANLQAGAIDQLKEAKVKYITIGSKRIDISLDTKAITQIDQQSSGTVALSAKKVTKLSSAAKKAIGSRPVFDITLRYTKNGKAKTISNLGSGTATIGIAYSKKASDTGSLWAVYAKSNGKVEWLLKSSYIAGKLVFTRTSLSIYGVGYKNTSTFTDTTNSWAYDMIHQVVSRGLLSGTTKQTFAPDEAITKADYIMALGKLANVKVANYKNSSFTDVKPTDKAHPYIEWAVANQIVSGIGNQKFGPEQAITREEMAVMLHNYCKAVKITLPVARQYDRFADDYMISYASKDKVKRIVQAGLMSSKVDNLFNPQQKATRADAVITLQRLIERIIHEETARGWVQNDSGQWMYYDANGMLVKDAKRN